MRAREPEHIARVLHDHKLHAVAEAKVRNLVLAAILDRSDLPFDAALAESARHDNAVKLRKHGDVPALLEVLRIDPGNPGLHAKPRA